MTSQIIARYQEAGCPLPNLTPRSPEYHAKLLQKPVEFFGNRDPNSIRIPDCIQYRAWRGKNRSAELELSALSSCLNWAVSLGLVDSNRIRSGRPRFVSNVEHCREKAFDNADELFKVASRLLESPKSCVLGFQMLVEALTGLRTSEALSLRMDAKRGEPGYVEGNCLWVRRSKHGVNPFVRVHPALQTVISSHRQWVHSGSPWWFPGSDIVRPVARTSLTNAMRRICGNRTSHGLRAFYVTVRRSQGASDEQVAAEIGDSTVSLISRTYGNVPPNWATGGSEMKWLPDGVETIAFAK